MERWRKETNHSSVACTLVLRILQNPPVFLSLFSFAAEARTARKSISGGFLILTGLHALLGPELQKASKWDASPVIILSYQDGFGLTSSA